MRVRSDEAQANSNSRHGTTVNENCPLVAMGRRTITAACFRIRIDVTLALLMATLCLLNIYVATITTPATNQSTNTKPLLLSSSLSSSPLSPWHAKPSAPQPQATQSTVNAPLLDATANSSQSARNVQESTYFAEWGEQPPIHQLVDGRNIRPGANVSWLLDFAIVGFPKCGTSSLMHHLQSHPQVQIQTDERCDLSNNHQGNLVRDLYLRFPHDRPYKRGLKCPLDLENNILALPHYRTYFPRTRFLVGMRHPVLWFESFYNFRIHNKYPMPPAEKLQGRCTRGMYNVCTFRSNFHLFLSNFGKTNITHDPEERKLLGRWIRLVKPVPTPVPVFIYEVSQLNDQDVQREEQFLQDLQHFLGLTDPIDSMIWFKPGRHHASEVQHAVNQQKIDICDNRYDSLRETLLSSGKAARHWITRYFLQSPDVVVSSPSYFVNELLPQWEIDPCIERRKQQMQQEQQPTNATSVALMAP